MNERKITCIMCPNGCPVTVSFAEDGSIAEIIGNRCPKGYEYAYSEVHHPVRTLTSTVKTSSGRIVAVKSGVPVPKELLFDIMKEVNRARPSEPVSYGDAIIKNVCDTGADIIVTSD